MPKMPNLRKLSELMQNRMDREARKKAAKQKGSIKPPKRRPVENESVSGMMGSSGNFMKKVFQKDNVKKRFQKDNAKKNETEFRKTGGRIGLKAGTKGCKLAMKGRGKAYGKNS